MTLSRSLLAFATTGLLLSLASGCAKKEMVVVAVAPPPPRSVLVQAPAPPPPVKIALPGELEFDVNQATIKNTPESAALLGQVADILTQNPRITRVRIEGHTDSVGRPARNLALSQDRAETVVGWLEAHGIESGRLVAIGYGQTRPIVDNDSREHRRMNRRTEFHVQEVDGKPTDDIAPDGPTSPVANR